MNSIYHVKQFDDQVFGLVYRPSLAPERSDDTDFYGEFYRPVPREFSAANQEVLRQALMETPDVRGILEIGVQRNPLPESSTGILLRNKAANAIFIGIDIEDKSHLADESRGIFTIQGDSGDRSPVYALMARLGIAAIDFLFIDGWHSVNQCVADWRYVERLSPRGTVAMHDTNVHPGPVLVFDAIDERLFDKKKYCTEGPDWGISVIRRK